MKAIGKSDGVHGPQKTLNLFIYSFKQNTIHGKQHIWGPNVALIPSLGSLAGRI